MVYRYKVVTDFQTHKVSFTKYGYVVCCTCTVCSQAFNQCALYQAGSKPLFRHLAHMDDRFKCRGMDRLQTLSMFTD